MRKSDSAGSALRGVALGSALASAFAASACCIGPLLAGLLGVTGLGTLGVFEKYRPLASGVALAALGAAFAMTYRKGRAKCEPGSLCATATARRIERINRAVLWIASAITLLVLTFPTWSSWIWP